jgi:hypothetical protein
MRDGTKVDYCGYEGDHFLLRIMARLVPDKVFGVYLGDCCKDHDLNYDEKGPNKSADIKLRNCIKCRLMEKFRGVGEIGVLPSLKRVVVSAMVTLIAQAYYLGVRVGGIALRMLRLAEKIKRN